SVAHYLEPIFGLRARRSGPFWADSLSTLLQFHIAGRLGAELLGPRHAQRMQEMAWRAGFLGALPQGGRSPEQLSRPPLQALEPSLALGSAFAASKMSRPAEPLKNSSQWMANILAEGGGAAQEQEEKEPESGRIRIHGEAHDEERRHFARLAIEKRIGEVDP